MKFKLLEFNPRRYQRGAEAARVEVDGEWLWMSRGDLLRNIRDHGNDPELRAALVCYTRPGTYFHHDPEEMAVREAHAKANRGHDD